MDMTDNIVYVIDHKNSKEKVKAGEIYEIPPELSPLFHTLHEKIWQLEQQVECANSVFKIIKRNLNTDWRHQDRKLTKLEQTIKSQVCGYLGLYGIK